jgi:PAS domain-containing protein
MAGVGVPFTSQPHHCTRQPTVDALPLPNCQVGVALRFQLGGSDSQRVVVVVMRRLEEARLMLATDHKGRLVYANTGLAAMLGYKLAALRTREFSTLLPAPYCAMHTKFIKVKRVVSWVQAGESSNGVGQWDAKESR